MTLIYDRIDIMKKLAFIKENKVGILLNGIQNKNYNSCMNLLDKGIYGKKLEMQLGGGKNSNNIADFIYCELKSYDINNTLISLAMFNVGCINKPFNKTKLFKKIKFTVFAELKVCPKATVKLNTMNTKRKKLNQLNLFQNNNVITIDQLVPDKIISAIFSCSLATDHEITTKLEADYNIIMKVIKQILITEEIDDIKNPIEARKVIYKYLPFYLKLAYRKSDVKYLTMCRGNTNTELRWKLSNHGIKLIRGISEISNNHMFKHII